MCLFMTATLQVNFLQRSTLWFGMVDFLLLCKRDFTWVQWFMWINLLWVKTILRKHSGEESIKMLKNRSYQWSYRISMALGNAVFFTKEFRYQKKFGCDHLRNNQIDPIVCWYSNQHEYLQLRRRKRHAYKTCFSSLNIHFQG